MVSPMISGLMADRSLSAVVRQALATLVAEIDDLRRANLRQASRLRAIDDDLRGASVVQRGLLPARMPHVRGLNIETLYRPAGLVSGDLYDVCRVDSSHVAFWLADATGHGLSAGLIAAFVKGAFQRNLALAPHQPASVLAGVNGEVLSAGFSDCQFVTAVCGIYNENHRVLRIARAGAPHPLILHPTGLIDELAFAGPMLGVSPACAAEFAMSQRELTPGQTLVLHTDGVESPTQASATLIAAAARTRQFLPSLESMLVERQNGKADDDVTVLAFHVQ